MPKPIHPTKRKLLEAAMDLLANSLPEEITSDQVLQYTGVSKGSLYHHFEDFYQLIDSALVEIFVSTIDDSIYNLKSVIKGSNDRLELMIGLRRITEHSQSDAMRTVRFRRARMLALAEHRPQLRERLAREQGRLTRAFADLFVEAREKGWFNEDFDPKAAAVLIQAYTFGRVIDEISDDPVDIEKWVDLIMKIVSHLFLNSAARDFEP